MNRNGTGTGNRYANDLGGNHLDRERRYSASLGYFIAYGKRFCESCQTFQPTDKTPAKKGWKCKGCKTNAMPS
jgi:hypothetical protein